MLLSVSLNEQCSMTNPSTPNLFSSYVLIRLELDWNILLEFMKKMASEVPRSSAPTPRAARKNKAA